MDAATLRRPLARLRLNLDRPDLVWLQVGVMAIPASSLPVVVATWPAAPRCAAAVAVVGHGAAVLPGGGARHPPPVPARGALVHAQRAAARRWACSWLRRDVILAAVLGSGLGLLVHRRSGTGQARVQRGAVPARVGGGGHRVPALAPPCDPLDPERGSSRSRRHWARRAGLAAVNAAICLAQGRYRPRAPRGSRPVRARGRGHQHLPGAHRRDALLDRAPFGMAAGHPRWRWSSSHGGRIAAQIAERSNATAWSCSMSERASCTGARAGDSDRRAADGGAAHVPRGVRGAHPVHGGRP